MSETQLRIYCFEQARLLLGFASLADILAHAEEIYDFLTGVPQSTAH